MMSIDINVFSISDSNKVEGNKTQETINKQIIHFCEHNLLRLLTI